MDELMVYLQQEGGGETIAPEFAIKPMIVSITATQKWLIALANEIMQEIQRHEPSDTKLVEFTFTGEGFTE